MPSSPVVPVRTGFLEHVQHSWPLAVIIGGLALYAAIALISGRFYTNQGTVRRSDDPRRYLNDKRRGALQITEDG
jgi:hypothetical protein